MLNVLDIYFFRLKRTDFALSDCGRLPRTRSRLTIHDLQFYDMIFLQRLCLQFNGLALFDDNWIDIAQFADTAAVFLREQVKKRFNGQTAISGTDKHPFIVEDMSLNIGLIISELILYDRLMDIAFNSWRILIDRRYIEMN